MHWAQPSWLGALHWPLLLGSSQVSAAKLQHAAHVIAYYMWPLDAVKHVRSHRQIC